LAGRAASLRSLRAPAARQGGPYTASGLPMPGSSTSRPRAAASRGPTSSQRVAFEEDDETRSQYTEATDALELDDDEEEDEGDGEGDEDEAAIAYLSPWIVQRRSKCS